MIHIVVNPVAGHGKAVEFVQEHVVTLLDRVKESYKVWTTTAPRHAGEIAQSILSELTTGEEVVKLVVAGGDGTAHELIEGIKSSKAGSPTGINWELVILPLGTANALHASLFSSGHRPVALSLESFISPDPEVRKALSSLIASLDPTSAPHALPITSTSISGPTSDKDPQEQEPIYSHVVTSTALHAAILQTSEELRAEYPGLQRFKMAAERNLGVFFRAKLRLLPPRDSTVQQYDPKTKSFVEPYTTDGDSLEGPFTYVLSTTICERLEPTFVINPTLKTIPPQSTGSMDLVVLRPLRDPDVRGADPSEQPERWKKRAMEVIGQAYKEGGHVDLRYPDEGGQTARDGDGQVAVETFRVGGFEWVPTDAEHTPSHLVCADGAIHTIPPGGQARIEVARQGDQDHSVWVWS